MRPLKPALRRTQVLDNPAFVLNNGLHGTVSDIIGMPDARFPVTHVNVYGPCFTVI